MVLVTLIRLHLEQVLNCSQDQVSIKLCKVDQFLEHKLKGVKASIFTFNASDKHTALALRTADRRRVDAVVYLVRDVFAFLKAVCVRDFRPLSLSCLLDCLLCGEDQTKSIDIAACNRELNVVFWATQA